jgi:KipI family sensor histidine kinase inhibitor
MSKESRGFYNRFKNAMLYKKPIFRLMGDRALLVELGDEISPAVNQKLRELFVCLEQQAIEGLVELVAGYCSLLVICDPITISVKNLENQIAETLKLLDMYPLPTPKTVEIPVVYGQEYGPDLEWVAEFHKITPQEVIRLHTQPTYRVYMIGFTPGFPYLGEVPDALAIPRRETPRTHVSRGSVAIAQKQTGIYPVESPGGWQIIGRTPMGLFHPQKQPPSLLEMGDLVKFYAISSEKMVKWRH